MAAIAVLLFAIRGVRQGTIRQAFALLGVFGGLWSLFAVSQWVGSHWQGARPAVVFWVLRWVVAALASFAVAALFQWLGETLSESVRGSSIQWLDRTGGFFFGAGLGACAASAALVAMLVSPWPRQAASAAARARSTPHVVRGAQWLFERGGRFVPGSDSLRPTFAKAERLLRRDARY